MKNRFRSFFAAPETGGVQRKARPSAGQAGGQGAGPVPARVVVFMCEVTATLALAYIAVQFTHTLMTPERTPSATAPQAMRTVSGTGAADYSALLNFDPFFRAVNEPAASQNDVAPESSLKLALFGLRAGADGNGTAIVTASGEAQKLVRIGDEITSGVSLSAVYADRIEVSRRGMRETIYLKPKGARMAAPKAANRGAGIGGQDLLSSLGKLDLTPVMRGGRLVGFRTGEGADNGLLARFGLQPNDILIAVNDSPLTSFERLKELPDEFATAKSLTLEIERNGAPVIQQIDMQ
ncbi:type II secretion system protein N [Kordiimonas sp.]|uniref:type II secretion system protein N n=1 Tax=Kordiimonas sp. TaxID=1970157 RepID=UPI003A95A86B